MPPRPLNGVSDELKLELTTTKQYVIRALTERTNVMARTKPSQKDESRERTY